ncbi:MAG: sodium/solute symporter [Gammaproteobacteria bacterium]|nr:sodium/solute symporter [Gammaproteobacteria bacterium]MXY55678.1 sodium/solute symporter [Gammaproteobacteria bacterium]MYK46607.1 sodium/solute symporter [Gammaproteobacteria bacterium]
MIGSWLGQHWFAVALAVVYTSFLLAHARLGLRAGKTAAGFFIGNRGMGGAVIGVSFYATFASTNSYVGLAGKSYEYGLPWLTMAALMVVFCWLSWRIVAPRMRRFAAAWGSLTVPDFLAVRFASDRVRVAAAAVIVFSCLLYLIAVFKGAGNLLQVFLGIPYQLAVIVTLGLIVMYTMLGGFVSVVRTDVLQGSLMVVGSILLFYFITSAAGGVGVIAELPNEPSRAHLVELNGAIPFVVLIGIALAGSLKLLVDPRQVTRFYGLKDEHSVRVGVWVAVIGILVIQFCLFPLGLYAHFLLDGVTDTDLVVPTLVNDPGVIPPLVGDFLVIAILAAAMSSLDSVLLVAASVASRDLLRRRAEASVVGGARLGVAGFAVVAAIVALNPPGGIVEITIFSGSLFAVCFVPTILLGLHWRRGNEAAALTAFGLGIAVLLGWLVVGMGDVVHEVFPALIASTLAYVVIAARSGPVPDPEVQRLFTR